MIQVSAFVIEDDGCVLSAAITGASLAIAHGRLPLFDFAAAVSIVSFGLMLIMKEYCPYQID